MTQHLTVNSSIFPSAIDNRYPVRMYHTACGRLVTAAHASRSGGCHLPGVQTEQGDGAMTLHADSSVDDFVAFIANERVSVEDAWNYVHTHGYGTTPDETGVLA